MPQNQGVQERDQYRDGSLAMTHDTQQEQGPIRIDHHDGDRNVVLTPANQDRFIMSCKDAVASCESVSLWSADFRGLIAHLTEWVKGREGKLTSIFVSPADRRIGVFVVSASESFDFDLAEQVAELSHEILLHFKNIWPQALLIPGGDPDCLASFVDQRLALQVYGPISESQETMAE